MATLLTRTRDLLMSNGWVFHREGETISPDREWIVKTGYANFESYLQLQKPDTNRSPILIEHWRIRDPDISLQVIVNWLATYGIRLENA